MPKHTTKNATIGQSRTYFSIFLVRSREWGNGMIVDTIFASVLYA
jgi:hypothetical protein